MFCCSLHDHRLLHLDRKILVTSKAVLACGGTELPVICSFSPLPGCSARCLQQVLARCKLSQQTEVYAKSYLLAVWWGCFCTHGLLRLLKIWNVSRICVSSLRRDHANLLCIDDTTLPQPAWMHLRCISETSHGASQRHLKEGWFENLADVGWDVLKTFPWRRFWDLSGLLRDVSELYLRVWFITFRLRHFLATCWSTFLSWNILPI